MKKYSAGIVAFILAALMLSQFLVCAAAKDDPFICVRKVQSGDSYSFMVLRVADASTGILNMNTNVTFNYVIECETDEYEVIKRVEGSSSIPSGTGEVYIDVSELVAEMKAEVKKYKSITIICSVRNVKGGIPGTDGQIVINNYSAYGDPADYIKLEPPRNVMAELREKTDGSPYFVLKWTNPQDIWDLEQYRAEQGEAGAEFQIDMKIGDGQWRYDAGKSLYGNGFTMTEQSGAYVTEGIECDPIDLGASGTVDIRANTYYLRVRYAYLAYSDDDGDHWVYSPFSNVASVGVGAFYKEASEWAKPELQKANELGLIPDILKGADMTKPITREEFAELAVLLYENVTKQKSTPVSPNPFTDTSNPQILKAYNLGITTGTSKTTFSPNVLINREQCATMLLRAIKAIHPQGDYSVAGVKDFPDQKHISDWAVEATKYMNKMGILTGDAQGNFMPKATTPAQEAAGYGMATREQAVALSVRTYDKAPEIMK
jgi:hypothetical protein